MTINVEIVEPRVCLVFDACNSIITANVEALAMWRHFLFVCPESMLIKCTNAH
jgi:hypothetical protein